MSLGPYVQALLDKELARVLRDLDLIRNHLSEWNDGKIAEDTINQLRAAGARCPEYITVIRKGRERC